MAGLLNYAMPTMGEEGGAGAGMQVPEGLGPEATQMFHNPSATNWGNYMDSASIFGTNPYHTPQTKQLWGGLEDQGYNWDNVQNWEDDYNYGEMIAGTVENTLSPGNNSFPHIYPGQGINDIVEMISETQYGRNNPNNPVMTGWNTPGNLGQIGNVATDLLNPTYGPNNPDNPIYKQY